MKTLMTLIEAIALIAGAASAEDLNENVTERFLYMNAHPLHINLAKRSSLASSGLFTDFQIVSLLDYIENNGPVLSGAELALIDGFDGELADALSYFISFTGSPPVGHWEGGCTAYADVKAAFEPRRPGGSGAESGSVAGNPDTGGTGNLNAGGIGNFALSGIYGIHSSVSKGESFSFGIAGGGSWAAEPRSRSSSDGAYSEAVSSGGGMAVTNAAEALSLYCAAKIPHRGLTLIAGDFNARFAQGLSAWNTMSLSDLSSASSLIKRPSGLAIPQSLTGNYAMTGLAAALEKGSFVLSAALSFPNLKQLLISRMNRTFKSGDVAGINATVNCNWWLRSFSFGFTSVVTSFPSVSFPASSSQTAAVPGQWRTSADFSADFRGCISGVDLASEIAMGYNCPLRAVLSTTAPLGECFRTGAQLKYAPSLHSATLIGEYASRDRRHCASLAARARHTLRDDECRADCIYRFSWADRSALKFRVREKLKLKDIGKSVFDCRADLSIGYAKNWATALSGCFSFCRRWGMVVFAEQNCVRDNKLSAYLRAGIFSVDEWNGRIYVYEHDIYGRFNVPAMYGRGAWTSFFANWRLSSRFRLSFRASYYDYFLMPTSTRKPSKAELRVLLSAKF